MPFYAEKARFIEKTVRFLKSLFLLLPVALNIIYHQSFLIYVRAPGSNKNEPLTDLDLSFRQAQKIIYNLLVPGWLPAIRYGVCTYDGYGELLCCWYNGMRQWCQLVDILRVLTYMRKVDDGDLAAREQGLLLLVGHGRVGLCSAVLCCAPSHTSNTHSAESQTRYHSTSTVISN